MPMKELVEAREELALKQKWVGDVQSAAGGDMDMGLVKRIGEVDVEKLSSLEKVEKLRELNDELADLGEKVDKLAEAEKILKHKQAQTINGGPPLPESGEKFKSFEERLVESEWCKAAIRKLDPTSNPESDLGWGLKDMRRGARQSGMKADFLTSAGWAPESTRMGLFVDAATRPIQILDIVPSITLTQAAMVYMEETTRTHAAAERAEAATAPESTFVVTQRTVNAIKILDSVPTSEEQISDVPEAMAYLTNRLEFGLRQRLDQQILTGNGTAPNFQGINGTTGVQTQAKGTDPAMSSVFKGRTKCMVTGRAFPNVVVIHPNDWQDIRLERTTDGIYILGNPTEAGPSRLWGLQVVESDAQTENTALVGDFANFCLLGEREGVNVSTGYVNDDFAKDLMTLKGRLRAAFAVTRAAAFCQVTGI